MAFAQAKLYTIDDIYALPDGQRAELIDGQMYMMAPPNTAHQRISHLLEWKIENYIRDKNGECEVFSAPFAVFLSKDNHNYLEPDISVICDKDKLNEKGCNGAPDWIIEITSPSDPQRDQRLFPDISRRVISPGVTSQSQHLSAQTYHRHSDRN